MRTRTWPLARKRQKEHTSANGNEGSENYSQNKSEHDFIKWKIARKRQAGLIFYSIHCSHVLLSGEYAIESGHAVGNHIWQIS
jgi:hypothetical protein